MVVPPGPSFLASCRHGNMMTSQWGGVHVLPGSISRSSVVASFPRVEVKLKDESNSRSAFQLC